MNNDSDYYGQQSQYRGNDRQDLDRRYDLFRDRGRGGYRGSRGYNLQGPSRNSSYSGRGGSGRPRGNYQNSRESYGHGRELGSYHGENGSTRGYYKDHRDSVDGRDHRDREYRDQREQRGLRDHQDYDPRDREEPTSSHDYRGLRDQRDQRDQREYRDRRDSRDQREYRDQRDPRDQRDQRDQRDPRDHRDDQGRDPYQQRRSYSDARENHRPHNGALERPFNSREHSGSIEPRGERSDETPRRREQDRPDTKFDRGHPKIRNDSLRNGSLSPYTEATRPSNPWVSILGIKDLKAVAQMESNYREEAIINEKLAKLQAETIKLECTLSTFDLYAKRDAINVELCSEKLEEFSYI
ncbi:hypothetical protein PUMCH_002609 [Australozyma saopauloensis]|uniref:Transcription regulator LGE1 helical region domain-containing protein n=1 Tax=Australozyma saopauloensis TaxID=291208 RepID=A0AAX4H9R8_9ASCO|nr:hypothetical protein PUMCH_002609 [[Candida] saopauloensis]